MEPTIVTLAKPIPGDDGQTVSAITVTDPNAGMVVDVLDRIGADGITAAKGLPFASILLELAGKMTGQSVAVLRRLSVPDLVTLVGAVRGRLGGANLGELLS